MKELRQGATETTSDYLHRADILRNNLQILFIIIGYTSLSKGYWNMNWLSINLYAYYL